MIMYGEYLDDIIEMLEDMPESILAESNYTKKSIAKDDIKLMGLWKYYQEGVSEYHKEPKEAFKDAMWCVFGIQM